MLNEFVFAGRNVKTEIISALIEGLKFIKKEVIIGKHVY